MIRLPHADRTGPPAATRDTDAGMPGAVLGFDIGGTTVKARAYAGDLTVLAESTQPSRPGPAIIDAVVAAAGALFDQLNPDVHATISAAGVTVPGLVDPITGVALRSVNLDLVDLPLGGKLAERLGIPVRVAHDVTAAGIAVHRLEECAPDPCIVVIGTGVAAASFIDGKVVRGRSSQAGEIGHIVVRPDGRACACGRRGCLETIVSAASITRRYAELSGQRVGGARDVVDRLAHDPVAAEVWDEAVSALADALVGISAVTAPGEFVLAGGLAEAGALLADPVNAAMASRRGVLMVPPVRVSSLGARAGVLGAGLLALDLLHAP